LQTGAPADVAIMELIESPASFLDTRNNRREGKLYLLGKVITASALEKRRQRYGENLP
jgi:hypothetical protein